MINSFYLLAILAKKHPLHVWYDPKNTPSIIMITSDIKTSSQHTLVVLNLFFGIIIVFSLVHFTLIQIDLPQEEVPEK